MSDPHLFQPLALRRLTTRNRVVISPMCQYSAHEGHLDDWHLVNLGRFATAGAGIIFTEATAVQKCGRITHGCAGLWADSQIPGHARIAQFVSQHGAIPAIQLGHAGAKSGMQRPWFGNGPLGTSDIARGDMPWTQVSPSGLAVAEGWPVPQTLTHDDIQALIDDFIRAATRALAAGYRIVEVHGAHGYLLHSFLSPLTNKRTDRYGTDRTGRMRLALEVTAAVRAVWPDDLPVFFRTSAVDGVPGGWSLEDTVVLARALRDIGVDVMDCSSGGITGPATAGKGQKRRPGFQVPYAETVRKEAGIATMAVGLIINPQQAEDILAQGRADLIAIGREALANPNWVLQAAQQLGANETFAILPKQSGWWLDARQKTSELS